MRIPVKLSKLSPEIRPQVRFLIFSITFGHQNLTKICEQAGVRRGSLYRVLNGEASHDKAANVIDRVLEVIPFSIDYELMSVTNDVMLKVEELQKRLFIIGGEAE
ncbi:hypothetical protein ACIGHG_22760 [Bacillus sp. NPDC077411]|uniref:hypothetical protein n=1 Tax=Bacillus sp. NPDC077411 TaxID=3363947 RepID=UPI0037CBF3B8